MQDVKDILKDWHRWSKVERVIAVLLVALIMAGVPAVLALSTATPT
jgi:hypothetical protein